MSILLLRRRFTVEDYHRMAQVGIFTEDDRVELLEGDIVMMTPIGSRHASCVARLTHLFTSALGQRAIVWVQNPLRLRADSEPQPDLALLRPRADFYATAHPGPEDVWLVVEVAETSADDDRAVKVPLYARSGIPAVWLVDLSSDRVEVYTGPTPEGYRTVQTVDRGHALALDAFPELTIPVDPLLVR